MIGARAILSVTPLMPIAKHTQASLGAKTSSDVCGFAAFRAQNFLAKTGAP
jgi:hypothetical protein